MTEEGREYGVASVKMWSAWFHNAGGWYFVFFQLLFLILDRGSYVASEYWISFWSDSVYTPSTIFGVEFGPQTKSVSEQVRFLTVFGSLIAFSIMSAFLRSAWAVAGGARCASALFESMTKRVLRAPMWYFETTPLGRILNRFTYDVEVLDIELSLSMTGLMISSSWLISSILVMVTVLPWMFLALLPVGVAYYYIQLYYRMTGPDLQRIDAISRSPIQANLAEGLEGLVTIRAFRKRQTFSSTFRRNVDLNSSAMLNFVAAQRWLGLRIEFLGSTMSMTAAVAVVCANDKLNIPPGLVGFMIQWTIIFTTSLNFFFLRLTESEARVTSIERIREATELPQEAAWETEASNKPESNWPLSGELEFDHACLRYRKDLPLALKSVSFRLVPGTRCGVVGRTGSGKTTLTAAIFRLVELESGQIRIDGVDLSKLGLTDVRGRRNGLRMIPQEPVLLAGTVRDCVDPFHVESDETLLDVLQAVNIRGAREHGMTVLDDVVEEGGTNFSVGERQLLCLARAIVEEPAILCLDEATASVDAETDIAIQTKLRTRFKKSTIAHRLHTIMDYDVVLVMDSGHAVEFGPPKDLLKIPNGYVLSLVEATGAESGNQLKEIAQSTR